MVFRGGEMLGGVENGKLGKGIIVGGFEREGRTEGLGGERDRRERGEGGDEKCD